MKQIEAVLSYYQQSGGIINGLIFLCALMAVAIGLERSTHFIRVHRWLRKEKSPQPEESFIVLRMLSGRLESMAGWITAAPLLGLLGTVIGMVSTFTSITRYGTGNPAFLTEGISYALHTTQTGLIVSIPIIIYHNHLVQRQGVLQNALLVSLGDMENIEDIEA